MIVKMLNYKKVLFVESVDAASQDTEITDNNADKLKDLKKEIKDLTDKDVSNDQIDGVLTGETLDAGIDSALNECDREVVNKLVNALKKAIDKNGKLNSDSSVSKLKDLLEKKQVDRIFNDFDSMMSVDKLKDLNHTFSSDEIDTLAVGIKDWKISQQDALNLYRKMKIANDNLPDHFRHTDKNYFNTIRTAIDGKYTLSPDNDNRDQGEIAREQLRELELWKLFENINAIGLNRLLVQYTENTDWDGSLLDASQSIRTEWNNFTADEFIDKFNEVNQRRIDGVKKLWSEKIKDLDLAGFTYEENDGNITFKKDGKEVGYLGDMNNNLDLLNLGELNRDHFKDTRDQWGEALKARIDERNKVENWEFVDGGELMGKHTVETVGKINWEGWISDDEQFLKLDNGKLKYNVKKAEDYLKKIIGDKYNKENASKDWTEQIYKNQRSTESLAWFAATQILLNEYKKNNKDEGDALLRIDWWIGPETKWMTKFFQDKYNADNNLSDNDEGYLNPDSIPWPLTMAKLLGNKPDETNSDDTEDVTDVGEWGVNWKIDIDDWIKNSLLLSERSGFTAENKQSLNIPINATVYAKEWDDNGIYYKNWYDVVRTSLDEPWIKKSTSIPWEWAQINTDINSWTSKVDVFDWWKTQLESIFKTNDLRELISDEKFNELSISIPETDFKQYQLNNWDLKVLFSEEVLANNFCGKTNIKDKLNLVYLASVVKGNFQDKVVSYGPLWIREKDSAFWDGDSNQIPWSELQRYWLDDNHAEEFVNYCNKLGKWDDWSYSYERG